jgi:hypothetical protein
MANACNSAFVRRKQEYSKHLVRRRRKPTKTVSEKKKKDQTR